MPSIFATTATLVAAYFLTFIYALVRNFFNARKTRLPSIIVPWDQNHFLWMLTSVPLRKLLQRNLPKHVYDRLVLCIYGWEFHERLRPFEQYAGPRGNDKSYVLVSCGRLELWTRDAEIAAQIVGRPRDFVQLDISALFMAKFGHNVLTTNGDRWARQRKAVASVINERISKAVFDESVRQTTGLLDEVGSQADTNGNTETTALFDMAKKITIHVLSGAGMGASVAWSDDSTEKPEPGFNQTYIQSIKTVINNITGPILLPRWFLSSYPSFLQGYQTMKSMSYAVREFPVHTANMLDNERQRMRADGSVLKSNIMSQLLHASERSVNLDSKSGDGGQTKALSDEEMIGNLFVFTAAGFDTTANTVSYALVLLARYPRWQSWLLEEIDGILPADSTEKLDYVTVFPKATRLMAFMLETLRLFTPLIHISKQTKTQQTIQTSKDTYWLPPKTTVYVNCIALHLDPEVWSNLNFKDGENGIEYSRSMNDAERFRPSRWINPPGSQQPLFQPPKGSFLPWSAGPRVCPGQKMAQVEFVAIFLTLLRSHKISAVALPNESKGEMQARLDARMRDSISILTLQMEDVYDVADQRHKGLMLRLSKR